MSSSSDWKRRGVRPKCAATVREDLKRLGSSTAALNVSAVSGPTLGMDIKRRQTGSTRTSAPTELDAQKQASAAAESHLFRALVVRQVTVDHCRLEHV